MSDPYAGIGADADEYAGIGAPASMPMPNAAVSVSPENYSPVEGNSFLRNALIGSGKFFTDLGLGARQVGAQLADGTFGTNYTPALLKEAAEKRAIDAPVMETAGGKVGQIGTGILTAAPLAAIPGVGTYIGAAGVGGGTAALQPVTAGESRAINTGVGAGLGIAGQAAGNWLSNWIRARATQPIIDAGLTPAQEAAAAGGQNLGMRLTPGQASGSRGLQQLEAKLESQPWTSGPFNSLKRANQEVLNNAAARSIGENGTSLDATVLDAANTRLGNVFESVRNPNSVIITHPPTTTAILDQIDQNASGLIPGSIRDNPLVSRFEGLAQSGSMTGEQLGSLSSKLGRAASKQMTTPMGDRDLGQALFQVKEHVDDLLESSLSPAQAAEYGAARGQYRNMMNLTSGSITNPSSGNVSGALLANKLQRVDRRGFLFGGNQSDLYNAARFAQAFKPIVGDSGTATRELGLGQMALAIPGSIFSRLYLSGPGQLAARGAVTIPQAIGGIGARLAAPVAPALLPGLPGGAGALAPEISSYLLQ